MMTSAGTMGALHENVRLQGMMMQVLLLVTILVNPYRVSSFQFHLTSPTSTTPRGRGQFFSSPCRHHPSLFATNKDNKDGSSSVEEYRNKVTEFLSNFMSKNNGKNDMKDTNDTDDPLASIDFNAPKIPSTTTMETLAQALDYELIQSEWFVTGNVNPRYVEGLILASKS